MLKAMKEKSSSSLIVIVSQIYDKLDGKKWTSLQFNQNHFTSIRKEI